VKQPRVARVWQGRTREALADISREEIKAYAGEHIERPHHLPRDAEYLLELPTHVRHFDILVNDWGVSQ